MKFDKTNPPWMPISDGITAYDVPPATIQSHPRRLSSEKKSVKSNPRMIEDVKYPFAV
jgi:hypothetical protein